MTRSEDFHSTWSRVPTPATRADAIEAMRVYFEHPDWTPQYSDEEGAVELMRKALDADRRRVIEQEQQP